MPGAITVHRRQLRCCHVCGLRALLNVALLLAVCLRADAARVRASEERLIGWKGEEVRAAASRSNLSWIETVAWNPRVFIYHNFATQEEVQHLIKMAIPLMRRSQVVADENSSSVDDYRTSYGCFLRRHLDPIVSRVQERVANWVHLPVINQEDMQILHYGIGQKYGAHIDSLEEDTPRAATVLIYLKDTEYGGETSFPQTNRHSWANHKAGAMRDQEFSQCAKGHVAHRPKAGDALLFWSLKPDGKTEDELAEHEGCPVVRGVKWTATIWSHPDPFRPESYGQDEDPEQDPGLCVDSHSKCKKWANQGDCNKNKDYMVGDLDNIGNCRKSCKMCEVCADSKDMDCYNRNRRKAGFLEYDSSILAELNS